MICDSVCGCGIISDSLTISGSGQQGDPWHIETNAFGIVTSSTHPSSPGIGQAIIETDTQRELYWDGSFWKIIGGAFPAVSCTNLLTDASLTPADATATSLLLTNEVYDSDGFHTGTTGVFTVPAGLGGDYILMAHCGWTSNTTGYRLLMATIGSNTTTTTELPSIQATLYPTTATSNGYQVIAADVRLEAGATVSFQVYQTSGAPLILRFSKATLRMVRHLPSLV